MKVHVKLTKDHDWQEVNVVGFYRPDIHHTVKIGDQRDIKYAFMKMKDGRVYDKENDKWILVNPETEDIVLDEYKDELPYKDGSVKSIIVHDVLDKADDLVNFIRECHRVLYPSGSMTTKVHLMPYKKAYEDPETKNYFSENTFSYFKKGNRYDLFTNVFTAISGDTIHVTLKK